MGDVRKSACLVINQIQVYSYGLLCSYIKEGQADTDLNFKSVGQCLMFVYGLTGSFSSKGLYSESILFVSTVYVN